MNDIQKKQCKVCSEIKYRIQMGKFASGKDKRWVDDTGKQWNGFVCPDCQRKRSLVYANIRRGKS